MRPPTRARNLRIVLVLLALVALAVACSDQTTQPSPVANPNGLQTTPPLAPFATFPEVTKVATIYLGPETLYDWIGPGRELHSRFVLHDDGTFLLQFVGRGQRFEYAGRYTRADSLITFDWDGWSTAGPWGATATLRGDDLVVRYNLIMELSDFVDGTYVRVRTTP